MALRYFARENDQSKASGVCPVAPGVRSKPWFKSLFFAQTEKSDFEISLEGARV